MWRVLVWWMGVGELMSSLQMMIVVTMSMQMPMIDNDGEFCSMQLMLMLMKLLPCIKYDVMLITNVKSADHHNIPS